MENETIKYTCGDHVCWIRQAKGGNYLLYTRDIALKQSIMMMDDTKWFEVITDPFDDGTIPVCNGDELMIVELVYGHATLAIDKNLNEFRIITAKRKFRFKY